MARGTGESRLDADALKLSVEATTKWSRSTDSRAHECICCDGPHVFGYGLVDESDRRVDKRYHRRADGMPMTNFDYSLWVHDAIRDMPEGARIRITIEEIQ